MEATLKTVKKTFFRKGKFYQFQECYVKVIQHLEILRCTLPKREQKISLGHPTDY
jgi:hypothetical protein